VAAEVYFSKRCAPITGSRAKCLSNGTNFMWPNSLQEFRNLIKVCFLFKSKIEINALTNLQADTRSASVGVSCLPLRLWKLLKLTKKGSFMNHKHIQII
jgi:hypothetical protein